MGSCSTETFAAAVAMCVLVVGVMTGSVSTQTHQASAQAITPQAAAVTQTQAMTPQSPGQWSANESDASPFRGLNFGESSRPPSGTPFVVAVSKPGRHNIIPAVRRAVRYWNHHERTFRSAYEKRLVFEPNASNPDILIRPVEKIHHHQSEKGITLSGWASAEPVSKQVALVEPKPMVIDISMTDNENNRKLYHILLHEMGHVLGVSHCQEPKEIMGCPGHHVGPYWNQTRHPFRTTVIPVYVNDSASPPRVRRAINRTLADANRGDVRGIPANMTYTRAADPWHAAVVIRTEPVPENQTGWRYRVKWYGGAAYDRNPSYLDQVVITLRVRTPTDARHAVGSQLRRFTVRPANATAPAGS